MRIEENYVSFRNVNDRRNIGDIIDVIEDIVNNTYHWNSGGKLDIESLLDALASNEELYFGNTYGTLYYAGLYAVLPDDMKRMERINFIVRSNDCVIKIMNCTGGLLSFIAIANAYRDEA